MAENLNLDIQWKYNIGISKEQWIRLLRDRNIFKQENIELLKLFYNSAGHMARASEISEKLKLSHYIVVNAMVANLSKRITAELNIEAPKYRKGDGYNWWHVLFWGSEDGNKFIWILRPELKEAMYELIKNIEI